MQEHFEACRNPVASEGDGLTPLVDEPAARAAGRLHLRSRPRRTVLGQSLVRADGLECVDVDGSDCASLSGVDGGSRCASGSESCCPPYYDSWGYERQIAFSAREMLFLCQCIVAEFVHAQFGIASCMLLRLQSLAALARRLCVALGPLTRVVSPAVRGDRSLFIVDLCELCYD